MDKTEPKTGHKQLMENCRSVGIVTRPHANNGLWLSGLLFLAHATNVWNRDQLPVDLSYKRSTIVSFGLLMQSVSIFVCLRYRLANLLGTLSNVVLTSFLLWICLKENAVFSTTSALFGIVLYDRLFYRVLKRMAKSFTLGEASIVCQGFVIFMYYGFLNVPRLLIDEKASQDLNVIRLVLQVILLGIAVIIATCHFIPFFRKTFLFYLLTISTTTGTALLPIFGQPVVLRLLKFLFDDIERLIVISIYAFLLLVTSIFVVWQVNRKTSANTATRKIFHILMVLVYLPGLCYQCTLLYVASGLMLGLLLMLETARVIQLKPFHVALEKAVSCFLDEKDAGLVALTPIYLLIGCSLPLWLHPASCDLTDSAGLNLTKLLAGVLSVGIGDTMASICGYYCGRHRWPGTAKSVEGTLAGIGAQAAVIFALYKFSFVHLNSLKAATAGAAIIINSLVEAKTNQVDNLVLPLVTFVVLGTA